MKTREQIMMNPFGRGLVFNIIWLDEEISKHPNERLEGILRHWLKILSSEQPQNHASTIKMLKSTPQKRQTKGIQHTARKSPQKLITRKLDTIK